MATYDEIQALMGAQTMPNSEEAMAQAAALRGQLNQGNFLSLSTIDQLQNMGQNQRQTARNTAATRGSLNRALAQEKRDAEAQIAKEQRVLKRTLDQEKRALETFEQEQDIRAGNRAVDDTRRMNQSTQQVVYKDKNGQEVILDRRGDGALFPQGGMNQNAEPLTEDDIAFMGLKPVERRTGSAYDGSNTGRMAARERRQFEEFAQDYTGAVSVIDSYDPTFSQAKVLGMDVEGVPFVNQTENFMARNAPILTSEQEERKAAWWQDWDNFYQNPERNRLFGSALTASEQAAWKAANINPSMTSEQIQAGINAINEIVQRKAKVAAENARIKGASEDYIQNNLQFITGGDDALQSRQPEELDDFTYTIEELNAEGISREEAEAAGLKVLE